MDERFEARLRQGLDRRAAEISRPVDVLGDVRRRARRQDRVRHAGGALGLVAVLGLGAFAAQPLLSTPEVRLGPLEETAEPDASPTPAEPTDPEAESCGGGERGVAYRIHYPAGWWAGDDADGEPCRLLHREPIDVSGAPRDTPEVAVTIRVQDRPLAEARTPDPDQHDGVAEQETTVDGRAAVIQEYVLRGDGIYPAGTTVYRYLVAVGDRTLSGTTTAAAEVGYDEGRVMLDTIMANLDLLAEGSDAMPCSAAGGDARPELQDGLPQPVVDARAAIAWAAAACDYERLAELAGEDFAYSFGDAGDFAGHLRRQEEAGEEPLRQLVALLEVPFATVEVEGSTQYVWPSAFAYDDWADVPAAEREALASLYGDDDFALFEQFGGYVGYRVGITADGRWRFFTAGD